MIAPLVRSSLAARSAVVARGARGLATTSVAQRMPTHGSMVTREEHWTDEDAQAAAELPKGQVVLSEIIPNIEARWPDMSRVEQYAVYKQLEEVQRKDWTELTLNEKKAGECLRRESVWWAAVLARAWGATWVGGIRLTLRRQRWLESLRSAGGLTAVTGRSFPQRAPRRSESAASTRRRGERHEWALICNSGDCGGDGNGVRQRHRWTNAHQTRLRLTKIRRLSAHFTTPQTPSAPHPTQLTLSPLAHTAHVSPSCKKAKPHEPSSVSLLHWVPLLVSSSACDRLVSLRVA